MSVSVLHGFYKSQRKAKKAAENFETFFENLRKQYEEDVTEISNEGEQRNWIQHIGKITHDRWVRIKGCVLRTKWQLDLLFLFGIFILLQVFGSLFYVVIALKFSTYSQTTGTMVSVVIQSIMFLIIVSRFLRVVLFVTLPSLITSRMRAILVIIMLIWAFQFPAQNITSNIQSAIEGVNCVSQRVKMVADEVKNRAGKSFHEATISQVRQFLREQSKPLEGIRDTMRKIDSSLDRMLTWQRNLVKKLHNLMKNCTELTQIPFKACIGWFTERHRDCQERYFEILCKPVDLAKHLCYLSKILQIHCDWPSKVKGGIKEGVSYFVKGAKRRVTDYARESFLYDVYNKTFKEGKSSYKSLDILVRHSQNYTENIEVEKDKIHEELRKEIKGFESFMDFVVFLLDILMLLATVYPFITGFLYVRSFKKNESTDNCYLDKHFEAIDEMRGINGQPTVLPLLPKEEKMYIRTCSLRKTSREKIMAAIAHLLLVFSILPIAVFIMVDIFVYKLIKRAFVFFHGNNTIFPQPSIYKIKVSGDGYLNKLLASILHTFEPLTDAKERDQMWRLCFTEPTPPNYELFQIILLLYLLCVLLITVDAYIKRIRHLIALHYYPDRAQPRALFLYNKIHKRRMEMFEIMTDVERSKMLSVNEKEKQLLFKGMSVLSQDKLRCYRCARTDLTVLESSNIRLCPRCHSVYCVDCHIARRNCVREDCRAPLQAISENVELYVDSSCESDPEPEHEQPAATTAIGKSISEDPTQPVETKME